ncbi:MAG: hypothetical protein LBE08_07560, partial [Bifidobacteriaceae bacterium]|nr:hypothetical protein [Bifidobacteriaceae bacterium]
MNHIKTRLRQLSGPVPLSVAAAFLIGAGFIALAGYSPLGAYEAMARGSLATPLGLANTLQRAVPLIGMAIAVAVAFRAGVFNIGMEGQMVMGSLAGAITALYLPGPAPLVVMAALVAGTAGGALWGLASAGLQFKPGVPVLISSLLLSYPARYFASWVVRFPLKDPSSSMVATRQFDLQLPMLAPAQAPAGQWISQTFGARSVAAVITSSVNWGLILVLGVVLAVAFANKRTVFGYETAMTGHNALFARYGGAASGTVLLQTMALSGGLSGLVGTIFVIGAP